MAIEFLRAFQAVADALSFSDGAKRLGLTQPAVSRQIRLLEESLKVRLFLRDRRGTSLTPEGRRLISELNPLMGEMDRLLSTLSQNSARISGTISLGCLAEIGQSVFMGQALRFAKAHPDVDLLVEYLKEFEIISRIKEGLLTFGVVAHPVSTENLKAFELLREKAILVTRPENPLQIHQAEVIPMIQYRAGDPLLAGFKRTALQKRKFRSLVAVNSQRSMVDALMELDAYAVVPEHFVEPYLKSGRLVAVPGFELVQSLFLVHLDNPIMEKRNLSFKRFLLDQRTQSKSRKTQF